MKVLFWLVKNKVNKTGECPIYCRITIAGKRAEMFTGVPLLRKQDNDAYQFIKTPVKTGRQYNTFTEILDGPTEGSFLTSGLYHLTF